MNNNGFKLEDLKFLDIFIDADVGRPAEHLALIYNRAELFAKRFIEGKYELTPSGRLIKKPSLATGDRLAKASIHLDEAAVTLAPFNNQLYRLWFILSGNTTELTLHDGRNHSYYSLIYNGVDLLMPSAQGYHQKKLEEELAFRAGRATGLRRFLFKLLHS